MPPPRDSPERPTSDGVSHPAILDEPHRRSSLSLLDDIQIASPCPANWDDMTGTDRARHCCSCDRTVYDLSRLTASQAEALIREKEGSLCVRLFRRADGRVMTADCPLGFEAKLRQLRDGSSGLRRYWWVVLLVICGTVGWLGSLFESTANAPSAKVPNRKGREREDVGKVDFRWPRGEHLPDASEKNLGPPPPDEKR